MLSVGINAAPLVAPRTGVGRYILGLLGGLRSIAQHGGEGEPFEVIPLFAPAAALAPEEPGEEGHGGAAPVAGGGGSLGLWRAARSAVKALPFAYAAQDLARAAGLERARRGGLCLFHETNHAAPPARLPVVLTVHDLCTLLYPEMQEPARARFFARALRERTRRAAQVIAPTAAIARQIVGLLGVEPGRVRAIHHGVDPALREALERPAAPAPLLAAAGVAGPYLLFVGALEPRKGLATLLAAYDQLPAAVARAFPLVLAGPAQRVDPALRRRLGGAREGKVVALGYTPPSQLPALYRGAAALCLPSVYEGFGLPLIEALACGTPCATSDDPALVEVAGGCALHAPRGDGPALAAQLLRLVEDAELRAQLAARGRARAAAFTWEASARAHLAAYREAAAEAGRAGPGPRSRAAGERAP